jgi:phosphoglycolate phosphatase
MTFSDPTILLDLDGTIIDSQPGILSSCRAALRALGHAPEPSLDISAFIGPPMEESMRLLLEPYGDDRVAEAVSAYRADYGQNGLFKGTLYPGISQALAEMQRTGAQLLLATSKRRKFAQIIIEHFDLAAFFEGIHGSEPGGELDHKPELISHIIDRHKLTQSRCVMVGDRRYDVAGAHANKIRALGVLWGYGGRDELEAAGADELVARPDDLPKAAFAIARMS